jgi:hypothetical protein
MERIDPKPRHSIDTVLQRLSNILLQDKTVEINSTVHGETAKIPATPEEGARLIHAFVRINQADLRAAIVKLTTQLAEIEAWD